MSQFFRWDDAANQMLRDLHQQALSFVDIADAIAKAFPENGPLTRNACIGRAHRLGLQHATVQGPRKPAGPRVRKSRAKAAAPAPAPVLELKIEPVIEFEIEPEEIDLAPEPAPAPIIDLVLPFGPLSFMQQREGRCRWPISKDTSFRNFKVCGCICKPTKPYCDEHSAKAYQPSRPRPMPQDRQNSTHASAMFFKDRVV